LQAQGLALRSARVQHYSPDPDYLSKLAYLKYCLGQAAQYPQEVVLVFLDEMGYYRWPQPGADWTGQDLTPVAQRGGPNNQQWRLIGTLNALTGQVDYLDDYRVGRHQVIAMYDQLQTAYPAAQWFYVVQDNWSVHQHPEVVEALQQWPHIEPVWLPTYAPWLNPIEKLWRWLRQSVLKMHRLATEWEELKQRVRAFLDQFWVGSDDLLRYVGLLGEGQLAQALQLS
jgi:hypothetical protein